MTKKTKVSVIIPVYNSEKYIEECLESVCNQTLSDIEVICVNDCSTDNSLSVLKKYSDKDSRIKLIDFKENKGAAVARNAGIKQAIGEFIGFVDSDDFIDPDFFEKLYNVAKETKADVCKGNIYDYNPVTKECHLNTFYDMNDKIEKNKHYFYYGFTSAIYEKNFIDENQIFFPEDVKYFEDPYFSIQVCVKNKKTSIVDDTKYYYRRLDNSLSSNHATLQNFKDFHKIATRILSLIHKETHKEKDYFVIFEFIYEFAKGNYFNPDIEKNLKIYLFEIIAELTIDSKYNFDINENLFKKIKEEIADGKHYEALLKGYQQYDDLNIDQKNPLVKILVSYIKPSFLLKTNILEPIHLGRAVEKENSKDGNISEQDLEWLHKNCIGDDDDFEGNISSINRRIGFLTGTYWAWKNYDKLGNPKYFGSYGYRKLLFPSSLNNLEKYDYILPAQMEFPEAIEDQFIDCHGQEYFEIMMDAIKKVYPEDLECAKKYFKRKSGYFAEMYIMKTALFEDFCNWIFKLLFYLTDSQSSFIDNSEPQNKKIKRKATKDILLNFLEMDNKEYEKAICKVNQKHKELRDLAFILERLTGLYLYKLTLNKSLKYKEIKVFEPYTNANIEKIPYKNLVLAKLRENMRKN